MNIEYSDILIIGDVEDKQVILETKEMLSGARKLADSTSASVTCLLAGRQLDEAARTVAEYGADVVLMAENEQIKGSSPDFYLSTIRSIFDSKPYKIILASKWHITWLARLAIKLSVPVFPEIIDINADDGNIHVTRSVHGGKAIEVVTGKKLPVLASVRSKAMEAAEPDQSRQAEINKLSIPDEALESAISVTAVEKDDLDGARLEDANVIISGGRGMGGDAPFKNEMRELAETLGGVVGASRPPADDGWVNHQLHIGLTGKIVAPELYVAVGISGASQHIAGCSSAKTIVAINKDKDAPIFKQADYGVVGKYQEVLPALTKKLREIG